MRPTPLAADLGEPGPRLSGPHEEPSGALDFRQLPFIRTGPHEFLARERGQADRAHERRAVVTKDLEEIDQFGVDVVVGLDGRRGAIDQDGRRSSEDVAEVRRVRRKSREDEIEMRVFAAVPSEGDEPPAPASGP